MDTQQTTDEALFDVPFEQMVLSSRGQGWHGFDAAEVHHPCDHFALPAIPRHVLVINLGSAHSLQEHVASRQGSLPPGGLTILPAGAPSRWSIERDDVIRHLHFYLDPTLLHTIAADSGIHAENIAIIDRLGAHDPQIEHIAMLLFSELRSGGLGGKIYAESLANLLAVQVLRNHSSLKPDAVAASPDLSRPAVQRAIEYIESYLSEDLSLHELAKIVHLSPYHFARLFKEATGLPPHRYIISRRVERAKLLLTTTNQSLTFIAHEVGFASESHLAMHFKRLTGLLPKHYR